jgi:hypothetical protein
VFSKNLFHNFKKKQTHVYHAKNLNDELSIRGRYTEHMKTNTFNQITQKNDFLHIPN